MSSHSRSLNTTCISQSLLCTSLMPLYTWSKCFCLLLPRNLIFQGIFCHALTIDQCVTKITLKKQGVGQHKNPAKQQNVKTETARNPTMLRRFCRKPPKNKKRIFRKKMLKQPTGYKKAGKKTTETHRQANGTSKDKKQQHRKRGKEIEAWVPSLKKRWISVQSSLRGMTKFITVSLVFFKPVTDTVKNAEPENED